MAETKIYPKGLRFFKKHENSPEFVKGTLIIAPNELFAWLKENAALLAEHKDEKQLRLQILENDKGLYAVVDTYKAKRSTENSTVPKAVPNNPDDLPF